MGTYNSEGYPMNTKSTGFRWFSKILCPCSMDESNLSFRRVNTFMLTAAKSSSLTILMKSSRHKQNWEQTWRGNFNQSIAKIILISNELVSKASKLQTTNFKGSCKREWVNACSAQTIVNWGAIWTHIKPYQTGWLATAMYKGLPEDSPLWNEGLQRGQPGAQKELAQDNERFTLQGHSGIEII